MKPGSLLKADLDHGPIDERFHYLAGLWKQQTMFCSSLSDMALHPAYQQIIGMGLPAVPLILRELAHEPNYWFWALKAITGDDPVPESSQGRLPDMTAGWLEWGRQHGYLD